MQLEFSQPLETPQNNESQLTVNLDDMSGFKQMVSDYNVEGQNEKLPPLSIDSSGSQMEVEQGDTFDDIARRAYEERFGNEPSPAVQKQLAVFIAKYNRMNNYTDAPEPGQILRIPSREAIEDHFNVCFTSAADNEEMLSYIDSLRD